MCISSVEKSPSRADVDQSTRYGVGLLSRFRSPTWPREARRPHRREMGGRCGRGPGTSPRGPLRHASISMVAKFALPDLQTLLPYFANHIEEFGPTPSQRRRSPGTGVIHCGADGGIHPAYRAAKRHWLVGRGKPGAGNSSEGGVGTGPPKSAQCRHARIPPTA